MIDKYVKHQLTTAATRRMLVAMTGALAGLIDQYKAGCGVSDAELARRIGISRQNLYLWRGSNLRQLPDKANLRAVAAVTGLPYDTVLDAALTDCGYVQRTESTAETTSPALVRRSVETAGRGPAGDTVRIWGGVDDLISDLGESEPASLDQAATDPAPDIPAYQPELWVSSLDLPGASVAADSRAEQAAQVIAEMSAAAAEGSRLGSKEAVRQASGVSVGTFNEAIKLAQARGVITSRPGPGGGIFAATPSPVAQMTGWFDTVTGYDQGRLRESIQIRDAIAPLLVDEALTHYRPIDRIALDDLLARVAQTVEMPDAPDASEFVWAAWNVHAHFAGMGANQLLRSMYLSLMDVGTSILRARLDGATGPIAVYPAGALRTLGDLVHGLASGDRRRAVDALRRTDPTQILRPGD